MSFLNNQDTANASTNDQNVEVGSAEQNSTNNEPDTTGDGSFNYEEAYKELEAKMGEMGNELGSYREFLQNISPVLEKLDENPELAQAIVEGKIDGDLVKAISEGRVDIKDAQAVAKAEKEVAEEVGKKEFENMTEDQIAKLIEAKADEIRRELEEKADLQSFEERTQSFIESTPDFAEYADEIDKWLDEHKDITDIEVAYWAVKGKMTTEQAQKKADESRVQANQELVANAPGGGVTSQTSPDGTPLIDQLVGGPTNPLNN